MSFQLLGIILIAAGALLIIGSILRKYGGSTVRQIGLAAHVLTGVVAIFPFVELVREYLLRPLVPY